jgi:hypothetical protein
MTAHLTADSAAADFVDGFEDGNADGWNNAGYGNGFAVVSNTAANGSHYSLWLHTLYGNNHYSGVYHDLTPIEPARVSFWVRPADVTSYTNYVVLRDVYGNDAIFFFADGGTFYVNGDSNGDQSYVYNALTWYHIEFRNIDFASQRFDYYVNGQLVKTGISFRYAGAIGPFAHVDLYSYTPVDAWFDEIAIGADLPGWLSVSPLQGTVTPGSQTDVAVLMRSAGLTAGDYRAALAVQSDDPDSPVVTRPIHFHVVGAPRVAWQPDSLDFGRTFIGSASPRQLLVTNGGDDTLDVSQIVSSDPHCVADTARFRLAPLDTAVIHVVYTPTAPESLDATLSFQTNDPHAPLAVVRMRGLGAYPPAMTVSPDSLVVALYSGDHHDETIQIGNTGLGPLDYHVAVHYTPSPSVHPARAIRTGAVRSILGLRRWGALPGPAPSLRATRAGAVPARSRPAPARLLDTGSLPIVVADSVGDGGPVDVVALRGAESPDSLVIEIDFATSLDLSNFEGILSLDMDRDPATGAPPPFGAPPQDVGAEYYVFMSTAQYGYVTVFTASPSMGVGAYPVGIGTHSLRFAMPRSVIHGGVNGVDVDLVVGPLSGLTDLVPDFGHGTIAGHEWLSVSPALGTVPNGQIDPVRAAFDAEGLPDGDYHADVVVTGNDPVHGEVHVPVHLHVTGGSAIVVHPDSLDVHTLFVGGIARETLAVENHGSADLHVTGLSLSDPHVTMTATPSAFVVSPGETTDVEVALTGVATGSFVTALHVTSDDPDQSTLDLPVTGDVADPPDVHLPQIAVNAGVQLGFATSVPFEIDNQGPSPLTWSADVVYPSEGAVVASAAPVTATARVRTPKPTGPPGDNAPPADRIQTMGSAGHSPAAARARRASRAGLAATQGTALYVPPSLSLAEVRDSLDLRHADVVSAIPNLYDFSEGTSGSYIFDGGLDMFDYGNYLNTDLGSAIPYSDSVITANPAFGPHGQYFTRKYPGLFVMAADLEGVTTFRITGDLGADGLGSVDAATLSVTLGGIHYLGFVKRVYGAGDASVNHLIIVRDAPTLVHAYSTDTNNDFDEVQNLNGIGRVYYLLFATSPGLRIDDSDMLAAMTRFVRLLPSRWLQLVPAAGVVPPHGLTLASLTIDGRDLTTGVYPETLVVHTDDPDERRIGVPVTVHADTVTAVAWSLVSADADRDAVRLVWNVSSGSGARGTVERRESGGAWSAIGDVSADGRGDLRFTDRDVTPGRAYGYRLHLTSPEELRTSEVAITVPDQLVFALEGPCPNPAGRELNVAFTLPDGAAATLELLDLAGRRLRSEEVGVMQAGRHVVPLGGTQGLPAGVYLIRLTRNDRSLVSKAAVVH